MSIWYLLVVTAGAAVCTNTWLSFVGKYNWGWRGVDTFSCLQGWNKDLKPAAVQRRHQLGLEPEKMSFTSSINTTVLSLSLSFTTTRLFHLPPLLVTLLVSLRFTLPIRRFFPLYPPFTFSKASLFRFSPSSSLNPSLPTSPCSPSSHLQMISSDTTLIFCQLFFPPRTSVSVAQ